jgi:hypothetical protein
VATSIVSVFDPRQPFDPIPGFVPSKAPGVHLQSTVDDLDLTICLRVISRTEIELGSLESKQLLPEFASKGHISVTHNGGGQAVELENMIKEDQDNT